MESHNPVMFQTTNQRYDPFFWDTFRTFPMVNLRIGDGHPSQPKIASIQREVGQIANHWAYY